MKKPYIQPRSYRVGLFTEDALLSISNGKGIGVSTDKETETRWSQKQTDMWGNSRGGMWDNMNE